MKNELKDQLDPYFNDIKDLIKSTAKGTEIVLRKEIERTYQAIKSVKEDMIGMEGRLTNEFKSEMSSMESRLSDKIDTIGARLDDHESKPVNIAHRAA